MRLRALQEQVDDQIDMAKQVGGFPAGWQRAGQGLHLWPTDEQTKKQRRQFMGIGVALQPDCCSAAPRSAWRPAGQGQTMQVRRPGLQ